MNKKPKQSKGKKTEEQKALRPLEKTEAASQRRRGEAEKHSSLGKVSELAVVLLKAKPT